MPIADRQHRNDLSVDGPGVYTFPKGVRYEGNFVEGKLEALKKPDCPVTQGPVAC